MHQGRIAEMKTGEGKTLAATLPLYLNALEGNGAHLVTVNDYLAKYQSELMGKIYNYLGLSVGVIVHDMDNNERREAYNADIHMVQIMSLASITFVIIWLFIRKTWFKGLYTMPLWTK